MHTPGSLTQPHSNDGSWNDEAPVATVTPVVNGRRSAGQSSCPGDTAPGSDIFDVSRDILSGASFKVLAKVIPNPAQLLDGQQLQHEQGQHLQVAEDEAEIPKSNSVNIFSIKDDPFDDEFFKST